jgi:photosystem II stability/assembly factor-like uncharacterized protein
MQKNRLKKQILVLGAILLSLAMQAQYSWQTLTNAPKSWRNDDIYFINPQMGWAIHGYYNYLTPNQYGQIWQTRDGGNTWQLRHDSSTTFYRCVGFTDSLHGWIGNLADSSVSPDTNALYYTSDGGTTVTPVVFPNPRPKGICGISVITDSVIYAYGRYFSNPVLAKTTDAGKTWKTTSMNSYASIGLIDGWFWNKDTGFITGQDSANAVILHTNDGGVSWQTVYHASRNDSDHVWKIFFPSRNIGYGALECLRLSQTKRYFVKTTDGGKTWAEYPFVPGYDEEGCGFVNDSTGWIGGDAGAPTYITFDGGNTWEPDYGFGTNTPPYDTYSSTEYCINRFRKFGDSLMYASGNTVYKLSGKITGIKEVHPVSHTFTYPNPFNDKTIITYMLPSACKNVKLEVYTGIGVKTFTKDLGAQAAGEHTYVFSFNIPPGAYMYRLTSENFYSSGKLIKTQ